VTDPIPEAIELVRRIANEQAGQAARGKGEYRTGARGNFRVHLVDGFEDELLLITPEGHRRDFVAAASRVRRSKSLDQISDTVTCCRRDVLSRECRQAFLEPTLELHP
jgi:hypothetical protein